MMKKAHKLVEQLDAIFHPESVAIIGLPRGFKAGKLFLMALLDLKYAGRIYPVHPKAKEIDGKSLTDVVSSCTKTASGTYQTL